MSHKLYSDSVPNLVKNFDINKIDSYGDKLNDYQLNILIHQNINKGSEYILKLEQYFSDEVYYLLMQYITHYDEGSSVDAIIQEYPISKRLEKILINMYQRSDHIFIVSNDPNYYIRIGMSKRDSYYIYDGTINLYALAPKLLQNPHASFELIYNIYKVVSKASVHPLLEQIMGLINSHPHCSPAKLIMKKMEESL